MPINSKSRDALVLNLGNIKVENKFIRAEQEGTLSYDISKHQKPEYMSHCLLDVISIQFADTDVYSAIRFKKNQYEMEEKQDKSTSSSKSQVDFNNFLFKQHSGNILEKKSYLFLHIEHNLESDLSHKSPDWQVHVKLNSFLFSLDLKQYILVRGILDQNIGEKISEKSQPTFLMPNTSIETVLTGEIWKCVCINLDLENVSIELLNNHQSSIDLTETITKLKKSSLAYLSFLKSSLTYESNSDQSKLIDLVSSEIQIIDKNSDALKNNLFTNILCNPKSSRASSSKRLQLELHYRSNKISNRYSILINNCRVIAIFDWLLKVKNFLASNYDSGKEQNNNNNNSSSDNIENTNNNKPVNIQDPIEIKINLTNTDLVLVENTSDKHSQAVILRLTAFIEYNQRKLNRPFESCLQSMELFSCQMSAIEETALSIIDPVTFNIYLTAKNSLNLNDEFVNALTNLKGKLIDDEVKMDYILDITTDKLKLRFSYLDFKLFLRLVESISKQLELSDHKQEKKVIPNKSTSTNFNIHSIELNMENFCICIIDDCKDVDIPLTDIQFNHLKMIHYASNIEQGSAEFSLNIDYYNRLLSGWEPLVEPWLARLNWKIKNNKNCFTLTSMDILNLNITNPFIDLITGVLANWKDEYNEKSMQYSTKRHKIFQPYKLINLTGEQLKFSTFKDTNSVVNESKTSTYNNNNSQQQEIDSISSDWLDIKDKCEKQFNFYENSSSSKKSTTMHSNHHYAQRAHNYQLRELVQHRIRVKLDDWSEIKPLTIDKVGNYFRDIYRQSQTNASILNSSCTRLIFDISLSGNATKLIKIKSPVSIKNRLNVKVQCRIEPYFQKILSRLGPLIVEIDTDCEISIPIKYLPCK